MGLALYLFIHSRLRCLYLSFVQVVGADLAGLSGMMADLEVVSSVESGEFGIRDGMVLMDKKERKKACVYVRMFVCVDCGLWIVIYGTVRWFDGEVRREASMHASIGTHKQRNKQADSRQIGDSIS